VHVNHANQRSLFHLQGCIELLDRSGVVIEGKEAVVLGRSNIVGKAIDGAV
jgi:5,10-methylene-tetrahydrofolate dehydrogenase/methenyl tetrahydrofolate cyclohydrolase